jgi:ribosome-binding factor A
MSRQDRVAEAIRQEASIIIHDKLKDPRLGFVTITKVEIARDLRFAKIFFSVLGDDKAHKETKEALDSSLGFVRTLIAERLNLRFAPEIAFYEDRSTEYSVRIEEILNQIKEKDEEDRFKKRNRRDKKT